MSLEKFNPIIPAKDDGFSVDTATPGTERKNQVIHHYLDVFTGTMKRKFNYLVYLDLLSGSGLKKINDGDYAYGSPILALDDSNLFSKYIFCVPEPANSDALRVRVNKYYRYRNVVVFNGDPNKTLERIEYYIPESTKKHRVSTLCVVDASSLDLDFSSIRFLADLGVNFLILLSLPLTKKRQYLTCINEERELLNAFLGKPWSKFGDEVHISSNEIFFRSLVKRYHQMIQSLGYLASGSFYKFDDNSVSIPYFFAGYYSHTHGTRKVQSEVLKKVIPQVRLFE